MIPESLQTLFLHWFPLEHEFMRRAIYAIILVGIISGFTGIYIIHRKMAFIGDALAHTTVPGVALAWMAGWNLFAGGLLSSFVTAGAIAWISRNSKIKEDAAIGVVYTTVFAIGVILMTMRKTYRDFQHILFGNLLGITDLDLAILLGVNIIVCVTLFLMHKELALTTYDSGYAHSIGLKQNIVKLILLLLAAMVVMSTIQAVGILMTTALLITPALSANLIAGNLRQSFIYSALIACGSGIVGLFLSFHLDFPPGATIVLVLGIIFAICQIRIKY